MEAYQNESQPVDKKGLKKQLSKEVQSKLSMMMAEYHVEGKKFKNKLKKAARSFATEIVKMNNKKPVKQDGSIDKEARFNYG
jgi:hypothetical protein